MPNRSCKKSESIMSSLKGTLFAIAFVVLEFASGGVHDRKPREPGPPYAYCEEEVVFHNEQDAVRLVGTLSLPLAKGPFPAVVLSTGSGPQDRNETVYGHR